MRTYFDRKRRAEEDKSMVNGIMPEWVVIERVFDQSGEGEYYVKWCGLPYTEATWEAAEDLTEEDQVNLAPNHLIPLLLPHIYLPRRGKCKRR